MTRMRRFWDEERRKWFNSISDPLINEKIQRVLRSRVLSALKRRYQKSARTMELVGCSVEELKEHLARQFQKGMSWRNHGRWHIDHIRPCSSFDLRDPEEQKRCFHFSNLQPLWAKDNIAKSNLWNGKRSKRGQKGVHSLSA